MKLFPHRLTAALHPGVFGVWLTSVTTQAHQPSSALPHPGTTRRCTSMHFGENQLFPSLIGLSPLPTAHPPGFQPWWVRASTRSYPRFTLAMGSSLRFGSRPRDSLKLNGYSKSHIVGILTVFQSALDYAIEPLHYISQNPMKSVKFPKVERNLGNESF